MDRIIDKFYEAGIQVILGTPTYSIPAWMWHKHPEVLLDYAGGSEANYGIRQNMNITNPTYLFYSERIIRKMMEHFAQTIPDCRVEIEDNAKDVETIHVRDDGSIWVLSSGGSRDNPDGSLGTFDVYNKEGQFVKNVTLMGDGDPLDDSYMFVKDRVYVVTDLFQAIMVAQGATGLYDEDEDEEAEPMAVRCYKLEGDLLSAR